MLTYEVAVRTALGPYMQRSFHAQMVLSNLLVSLALLARVCLRVPPRSVLERISICIWWMLPFQKTKKQSGLVMLGRQPGKNIKLHPKHELVEKIKLAVRRRLFS